jgi:photosystem II stability/assembly factor-like uncharacterized protein
VESASSIKVLRSIAWRGAALAAALFAFSPHLAAQSLTWIPQGPSPTTIGQVENIAERPVTGAVRVAVPHPTDANIVYIGAVNGGIWKTMDAMSPNPTWEPLTDDARSLSTGALAFDPTDPSHQTLVAGSGRYSSNNRTGTALIGLMRTADGGANWEVIDGGKLLRNAQIAGVAPRGKVIVVASDKGLFRSSEDGQWKKISGAPDSGLPSGAAFDLASDPDDPARLYTNAGAKGIFQSLDSGATWTKISDAAIDEVLAGGAANIRIAVGPNHTLYVAIAGYANNAAALAGLFRSADGGATWTALDLPSTIEAGGIAFGLHPGGQAGIHLSLAADRTDANIVYIGGDRQPTFDEGAPAEPQTGCFDEPVASWPNSLGACNYTGRLFRIDASQPPGQQATPLTHKGTASMTAPHADSRGMAISPGGDLIEVDDGGVYRRTNPRGADGDWFSMNGTLQVTEFHSAAWDANTKTILGGAQDTGTPHQSKSLTPTWETILEGDGGVVAIDVTSTPGRSIRYVSFYGLEGFSRLNFDATNTLQSFDYPQLAVVGPSGEKFEGQFYTPIELNQVDAKRLIIGGARQIYESFDQGDTIQELQPPLVINGAETVAYGGAGNPDMLYVGVGKGLYVRSAPPPAPLVRAESYPGKAITGIAIDPNDPNVAFVMDFANVYRTGDGGATWTKVTGNLATHNPDVLRSVVYSPDINGGSVVVGTNAGVFAASGPDYTDWIKLGTGLPNAPVYLVQWSPTDQILLAGTHGRGAWVLDFKQGP